MDIFNFLFYNNFEKISYFNSYIYIVTVRKIFLKVILKRIVIIVT